MSLMITAYLMEKYGPRLGTEELAEVLGMSPRTLGNKLYRGEVPVPTYKDLGMVWADCWVVAVFLVACRATAKLDATPV